MLHCRMEVDEFALHDLICIKSEDHYLCDAPINSIKQDITWFSKSHLRAIGTKQYNCQHQDEVTNATSCTPLRDATCQDIFAASHVLLATSQPRGVVWLAKQNV